jgi:hypothetical protein
MTRTRTTKASFHCGVEHLSMAGVYEAIGGDPGEHCDACFSGRYPLEDPDEADGNSPLRRSPPGRDKGGRRSDRPPSTSTYMETQRGSGCVTV